MKHCRSSKAKRLPAPTADSGKIVRLHDRAQRRAALYRLATSGDWNAALAFIQRYGRWSTMEERQAIIDTTIAKHPPRG